MTRRIHLVVNSHRPDAVAAAKKTGQMLLGQQVEVAVEAEAGDLGLPQVVPSEVANADLAITFGGDGTLIRAAHLCSEKGTPILGVYYGRFGFVTQCHPRELGAALSQYLDGHAPIEPRMMVQAQLYRGGKEIATLHALNDASLQRATTTRMLDFEIEVDDHLITRYPADGVVISTPTGSTAYNLSTGGPIVDPSVEAILLSAIAPHTLSARALVFSAKAEIKLRIETRGDALLSCDGQIRLGVLSGDEVRIRRSPRVTNLVCVDEKDFLSKVSERLLWVRPEGGGGAE